LQRFEGDDQQGDRDRQALGNPSRRRFMSIDGAEITRYFEANSHRF